MKSILLKNKAGRRFHQGHPWVFSNELEKPVDRPVAGEIVRLLRSDGKFLAHGFYHPHSLIAFRLLNREESPPDDEFFSCILDQAIALREQLYPDTSARRLVHSESDNLPGLIVDQYGSVLSVQVNSAGMENILDKILSLLEQKLSPTEIVIRNDSALRNLEGLEQYSRAVRSSASSLPAEINENDIRYLVDVLHGQKTGFFIDQRENRMAFRRFIPRGAKVLDAFCNDGGFAFNAMAAGAAEVDAVDISDPALSRAKHNASLNGYSAGVTFNRQDVMKWLPTYQPEVPYDVVNLDPPAFASNRKSVPVALKAYQKLHAAGMRVLKPGGIMSTACCSHHVSETDFIATVLQAAIKSQRFCQVLYRGGPPADHPVLLAMPESGYLKFLVFRVL